MSMIHCLQMYHIMDIALPGVSLMSLVLLNLDRVLFTYRYICMVSFSIFFTLEYYLFIIRECYSI